MRKLRDKYGHVVGESGYYGIKFLLDNRDDLRWARQQIKKYHCLLVTDETDYFNQNFQIGKPSWGDIS